MIIYEKKSNKARGYLDPLKIYNLILIHYNYISLQNQDVFYNHILIFYSRSAVNFLSDMRVPIGFFYCLGNLFLLNKLDLEEKIKD